MKFKEKWTCPKCNRDQKYSQPIIMDGMRGYITPDHGCGPGFSAVNLRPCSKEKKAFWKRIQDTFMSKWGQND